MIKTILWDFDGVILDSMKIKGDGFIELFQNYDSKYTKEIEKYHYANGGISRFDKIRYFYNKILKIEILEDKVLDLSNNFAKIIEHKLNDKNNLINETIEFIKSNYQKYNFHIVSGAEHYELNNLCDSFELTQYFISIHGSPIHKNDLVKYIIEKYKYSTDETILIGDAMTDYNASVKNGIEFYGYNNIELKIFNYIDSFDRFII